MSQENPKSPQPNLTFVPLNNEVEYPIVSSDGAPAKPISIDHHTPSEEFLIEMLNVDKDYRIANPEKKKGDKITTEEEIPPGLEVLSSITNLCITTREIVSEDPQYRAYTQYDLMDEKTGLNIAIGLEKVSRCSACCCLDGRLFEIRIFDYRLNRILKIVRRCTCAFCCAKYYICCCFGTNRNGNVIEIFDAEDQILGSIKQCNFLTKRLIYLVESHEEVIKQQKFSWTDLFCHLRQVYKNFRIYKFDYINSEGVEKVRIEQYFKDCYQFKLIHLQEIFNVGCIRRCGTNSISIELWKYFTETEKAVILASAFLVDHLLFGLSIEGSYLTKSQLSRRKHNCVYKCCCLNLCRVILFAICPLTVCASVISFLIHTYS